MAGMPTPKPRGCSTICLLIRKDHCEQLIDSPPQFRAWVYVRAGLVSPRGGPTAHAKEPNPPPGFARFSTART
jgi:hypothetical protein